MGEYIAQHMLAKQVPIGLLLADLRRRQRQAVEMRVRDLGLSNQQFWLLVALVERQGASLAEILAGLPMDQPTASRVLAALSRRKLVRLDSDPADRRRRRMVLTPRGEQFGARCLVVAEEVRKAAVAHFSSEEIATLHGCFGGWWTIWMNWTAMCRLHRRRPRMDWPNGERAIDSGRRCT